MCIRWVQHSLERIPISKTWKHYIWALYIRSRKTQDEWTWTVDISNLLQLIKDCPKLQLIHCSGPIRNDPISIIEKHNFRFCFQYRSRFKVDVDQYIDMVEIARHRSTHLNLYGMIRSACLRFSDYLKQGKEHTT